MHFISLVAMSHHVMDIDEVIAGKNTNTLSTTAECQLVFFEDLETWHGDPGAGSMEGRLDHKEGRLVVWVVEGRSMPKMDFFGEADPYCFVVFGEVRDQRDGIEVAPDMVDHLFGAACRAPIVRPARPRRA